MAGPYVVLKSTTSMSLNERFTEMLASRHMTIQAIGHSSQAAELDPMSEVPLPHEMETDPQVDPDDQDEPQPKVEQQQQRQEQPSPSAGISKASLPEAFQTTANSANQKAVQTVAKLLPVRVTPSTLKSDLLLQQMGKSDVRSRLGWPMGSMARRAPGEGEASSSGGSSGRKMQGGWASRPLLSGNRGRLSPRGQEAKDRSVSPQMSVRSGYRRGLGWRGSRGYAGHRWHGSSMAGREQGYFGRRGRNWQRSASQPLPTKEQLDKQLDAYMDKSRGQLEA